MQFNNKTKLLISVSSNPTNFGVTIYNHLFKKLNMNFVYLPFNMTNAENVISIISKLSIHGCSVSSPLKHDLYNLVNEVDPVVNKLKNINTILNESGNLKGFNTDYYGFKKLIEGKSYENILIYGYGSVTNTIVNCLMDIGIENISITGRDKSKTKLFIENNHLKYFDRNISYDVLINATPSGQENDDIINFLDNCTNLIDLNVNNKDSFLINIANQKGMDISKGAEMSILQLQKQFEIYFGSKPDKNLIKEGLDIYKNLSKDD